MVQHLYSEQLAELHRQDLIAGAASAHLRSRVDRERRRARFVAFVAWLSPRFGRPVTIGRARRAAPTGVETSLNIH